MYHELTPRSISSSPSKIKMSKNVSQITREKMFEAMHSVYMKRDVQMFIAVMTHAQTCEECSKLFFESMRKAKDHLESELK